MLIQRRGFLEKFLIITHFKEDFFKKYKKCSTLIRLNNRFLRICLLFKNDNILVHFSNFSIEISLFASSGLLLEPLSEIRLEVFYHMSH